VIMEAELARADGGPATEYTADREKHAAQRLYSVAPEDFVLPDILPRPDQPPRLAMIRGPLFRNRFDRDNGEEIAPEVVVNIKNVIHGRKFDQTAPELKNLEYIVFGKPDEVYLAHLVTRPPDFDHIVRVTLDDVPSNESLRHGMTLVIPGLRNHQKEEELDAIGEVSAVLRGSDGGEKTVDVKFVEKVFFNDDPNDFDV